FPVAPLVAVEIPDYGGRVGTHFREQAKGVRFDGDVALVAGLDFVSVQLALLEAGNEDLPQTGGAARSHRMTAAVPLVEFSDDTDTPRMPSCSIRRAPSFSYSR